MINICHILGRKCSWLIGICNISVLLSKFLCHVAQVAAFLYEEQIMLSTCLGPVTSNRSRCLPKLFGELFSVG